MLREKIINISRYRAYLRIAHPTETPLTISQALCLVPTYSFSECGSGLKKMSVGTTKRDDKNYWSCRIGDGAIAELNLSLLLFLEKIIPSTRYLQKLSRDGFVEMSVGIFLSEMGCFLKLDPSITRYCNLANIALNMELSYPSE